MPNPEYLQQPRQKVGSEFILAPGVAILTFDDQSRVLLIRQPDHELWSIPGGSIDPLQTPADAAVQVMWDKTGLYVEPFHIIGAYGGNKTFHWQDSDNEKLIYITIVFAAKVIGQELKPHPPKTLNMHYFSQDEIEHLATHNWVKMILNDAYRNKDQTNFDPPTWSPPAIEN
jgi:ADP-ribose pyrophosphatase YjhB (NUDIX family)